MAMARKALPRAELPEGFVYQPEFLSEAEERQLLHRFESLPFEAFDFHGYIAKRRIVEYGWDYNFGTRKTSATRPIPDFLIPLRDRAARFAGVSIEHIIAALVNEYPPGAPIGWHRDVPQFETVIGISLRSSCRMRLKPYRTEGKIVSVVLDRRSIYVLSGAARWQWQHSIAAVAQLRYSITFRTQRRKANRQALGA